MRGNILIKTIFIVCLFIAFEGLLIKHKSGVWILADDESEKDAEEVGGCTEIPVIYFEKKLIEWC